MAGRINGFTLGYAAFGGILLWSGIKGATISDTFLALLKGQAPTSGDQPIGTPQLNILDNAANGASPSANASTSDLSSGSESQNEMEIAEFLVRNGYSDAAAAGIVSCIAGESSADPDVSNRQGLIQWTPASSAQPDQPIYTGNASADMQTQLTDLLYYNEHDGNKPLSMLNAITDPVQAADFYSQYWERPLITDSDVRNSVATSVYNQLIAGGSGVPTG